MGASVHRGGILVRVLVWSDRFYPYIGGGEILGARLLRDLVARGHDVAVVTRRDSADLPAFEAFDGLSIHRFPFAGALQAGSLGQVVAVSRGVARLMQGSSPDLVHVNAFGPSTLFFRLASRARRTPVLVSLHEPTREELSGPTTAIGSMLRTADWIVASSESVLRQACRQVPEIAPRSSVILAALEMPELEPRPLPFDPPRVVCAGRLVQEKGFDLALEAFGMLALRHPTASLVIAGDGPRREALERQAARVGLARRIQFLGWLAPSEMPALLNTGTVVVVPSRREAFGLVALQAAQMGRPVVATRVDGLPEVVVDGETGILVERDDAAGMATALGYLLERPDRVAALGAAARLRAREVFDWERFVDAYDRLYHQVCTVRRQACDD